MNDFSEVAKKAAGKARPEPNWEGQFDCHHCFVVVDKAHYDPNKQTLTWYCPEGHMSELKDFVL